MGMEAGNRQETPSMSTEGHIMVAMKMHHSDLLWWKTDIPSCCSSGPTTTLTLRSFLTPVVPNHHGKGTEAGSYCEMQDSSKDNFVSRTPHRLESFLKLYYSLRLFFLSPSTDVRPLLQSESSPCLSSCSLFQEISCISNPILASVPWQIQANVYSNSCPINRALFLFKTRTDYT